MANYTKGEKTVSSRIWNETRDPITLFLVPMVLERQTQMSYLGCSFRMTNPGVQHLDMSQHLCWEAGQFSTKHEVWWLQQGFLCHQSVSKCWAEVACPTPPPKKHYSSKDTQYSKTIFFLSSSSVPTHQNFLDVFENKCLWLRVQFYRKSNLYGSCL